MSFTFQRFFYRFLMLCQNCFMFSFFRIHHGQIVSNRVLVPVIDSLRKHAKSRVHELRVSEMCVRCCIDLFHNGDQMWYSFVLMLISLISLAVMGTIQKNISTKARPVGLININTKG